MHFKFIGVSIKFAKFVATSTLTMTVELNIDSATYFCQICLMQLFAMHAQVLRLLLFFISHSPTALIQYISYLKFLDIDVSYFLKVCVRNRIDTHGALSNIKCVINRIDTHGALNTIDVMVTVPYG